MRYVIAHIGRTLPIAGSKLARERLEAERAAHHRLEARFGSGTRCLLLTDVRRVNCTVLCPYTLDYLADFPNRWLEGAPSVPMTPWRWRGLARRMDRLRKLLDTAARAEAGRKGTRATRAKPPKHDRAIKAAIAAVRARGNGRN